MHSLKPNAAKEHKTAYALKNNKLVHIADVLGGLSCGCMCAACGRRLIAKKGNIRTHHFAHEAHADCANAVETTLHLLAKELFEELTTIFLPQYRFNKEKKLKNGFRVSHESFVVAGGEVSISRTFIEQAEDRFIPDITLESNSKKLFIEIAVTHQVNKSKLRHIRRLNIPVIEIKLDHADATLTREALSIKLQTDLESKKWIFHPKQREAERIFIEKVRAAMRNARKPPVNPITNFSRSSSGHSIYSNKATLVALTNAQQDRLIYEFFLKFGRQPNADEMPRLQKIISGNTVNSLPQELSYSSIKGKRDY